MAPTVREPGMRRQPARETPELFQHPGGFELGSGTNNPPLVVVPERL